MRYTLLDIIFWGGYYVEKITRKSTRIGVAGFALLASGCSLTPEPAVAQPKGVFVPVSCKNQKLYNLNISKPIAQEEYQKLTDTDHTIYAIACQTANMIGKKTLQLYFHHSSNVIFKNSSDYDSYDFIWSNTKTGTYGDVTFAVKNNGEPNLKKITNAMVGRAAGKNQEAVSFDKESGSWDILSTGNIEGHKLPQIETQTLLNNPDQKTMTTLAQESFVAGLIALGQPE